MEKFKVFVCTLRQTRYVGKVRKLCFLSAVEAAEKLEAFGSIFGYGSGGKDRKLEFEKLFLTATEKLQKLERLEKYSNWKMQKN